MPWHTRLLKYQIRTGHPMHPRRFPSRDPRGTELESKRAAAPASERFEIGSSLAACAGAGAAGAVGVCGAGACAGWVCASRIRPDVSSARAALPNVTQAKRQAKSESANDSLYDVTMDFRARRGRAEREISASPG